MTDLISIIVPIYKVEDYLNRCVDSLLNQTYENIEIILIDDGSPDKCGEICDGYVKLDKRVKVIHKENGGLSDARNTGISAARGSYITFIDSDDWINKNYVKVLYELLKSKNADISACNFVRTFTDDEPQYTHNATVYEYSNIEALHQLVGEFYVQMVIACCKLYKTELFRELRFPVGKIHEDEFITYKLLYKANKVVFTTEPLLYYRQRSDSIMGSGFKVKNRLDAIEAIEERAEFFESIGEYTLKDKTYNKLLKIYKQVYDNIHLFEDEQLKKDFINRFKSFELRLRKSS